MSWQEDLEGYLESVNRIGTSTSRVLDNMGDAQLNRLKEEYGLDGVGKEQEMGNDVFKEFRDNMFWSWWYCGWDGFVESLSYSLKCWKPDGLGGHFSRDDTFRCWELYAPKMLEDVPNAFWDTVWATLVQMFGDYGTGPYVGWIEDTRKAWEFLEEGLKATWGEGEGAYEWIQERKDPPLADISRR